MGFDDHTPCPSVLLDKAKLPIIRKFKEIVTIQIQDVPPDSPFYDSLQAQLESAERAIHVIENS